MIISKSKQKSDCSEITPNVDCRVCKYLSHLSFLKGCKFTYVQISSFTYVLMFISYMNISAVSAYKYIARNSCFEMRLLWMLQIKTLEGR